jgi:hypothetical protein
MALKTKLTYVSFRLAGWPKKWLRSCATIWWLIRVGNWGKLSGLLSGARHQAVNIMAKMKDLPRLHEEVSWGVPNLSKNHEFCGGTVRYFNMASSEIPYCWRFQWDNWRTRWRIFELAMFDYQRVTSKYPHPQILRFYPHDIPMFSMFPNHVYPCSPQAFQRSRRRRCEGRHWGLCNLVAVEYPRILKSTGPYSDLILHICSYHICSYHV